MSASGGATLRVLRPAEGHPAHNLAVDAALLESTGPDTLRLYGWRPHGLSLGRFQDAAAFADVPGTHVMVRRQTGGGAIYHGDELTFSLALDARRYWPTEEAYARIHDAVVGALRAVGVPARRLPDGLRGKGARALRTAWCFADPGRFDVVTEDGRKLCGSAQRRVERPRRRVLHHGSIVLCRPPATPFCAAVEDHVDVEDVRDALASGLVVAIAAALDRRTEPGSLDDAERADAHALAPSFLVEREAPTTAG